MLLDSFNTTNQGVLVVGEEEDDFFGKTSGTGYSRMYINSSATRPNIEAILDSVSFDLNILNVDGANLDEPKYFSIHKLTEPILDTLYYNFDELSYEASPFSSGEIVFGEATDSLVSFPVKQEFADDLFSRMQLGLEFNDLFTFRNYFPGIAVKAREGDNSSIGVGVGSSTGMKFYYHYEGDTSSTVYNITTASSRSFNGVKSDRSGTPTSVVTETKTAYDVGPLVGIKSNLGMVIKLDTSPFDAFLDTLSGVIFNQVSLELGEIEPKAETEQVPANITIYFTDSSNEILITSEGTPLTVQSDGYPQVIINENGDETPNTSYPAALSYDAEARGYSELITSHVNAIFRGNLTRKDWLLYNSDSKKSLSQFIVNNNKIMVKVIYSRSR